MNRNKKQRPHELTPFLAMWAADYAKTYKLDGLHPRHYALLKKYGARLDDFTIATNAEEHHEGNGAVTKGPKAAPYRKGG
jgi:hypothetical protein